MASRAAERSVTLSLYRAMWRSTMTPAVRHSRFTVPLGNLPDNVSALARRLKPTDQRGLQALLRAGWRDEGGTLDGAFQALRALGELHSECEETVKRRVDKADRRGIHYQIGEVLRHKVFGFRAVVIGWDRRPAVDVSSWDGVQNLPSGTEQPFYKMLPDLADCIEHLGGPRDVRYVAQENLERLPLSHRRIVHPSLSAAIFPAFDGTHGRFVPSEQLAFSYPGSELEPSRHEPPPAALLRQVPTAAAQPQPAPSLLPACSQPSPHAQP